MARRYVSTRFNPYTYQELAAPIEQATAILAQQASTVNQLNMQNDALERYLDPELDRDEYNTYMQNKELLKNASDSLMRNGLTSDNFNTMWQLSQSYAKDIKPMQQAVSNRLKYNSALNELLMANPDAVVKGNIRRPLNDFYQGVPQTEIIKGTVIEKDVATIMKALGEAEGSIDKVGVYNKYNDIVKSRTGFTLEELDKMAGDKTSKLYEVINAVMRKYGVEDEYGRPLVSQPDYQKLFNYAMEGRYGGVGETKYALHDSGYQHDQANALAWHAQRRADENAEWEKNMNLLQLAIGAQDAGAEGTVSELLSKMKNGDFSMFDRNQPQQNLEDGLVSIHTINDIKTIPTSTKNFSVSLNGKNVSADEMSRVAEGAENYRPKPNLNPDGSPTGTYDWSSLDDMRVFRGNGSGFGKFYIKSMLERTLGKGYDLKNLSLAQVRRLDQVITDNAQKAEIVNQQFEIKLTPDVGKNFVSMIGSDFVGDKPTAEDLKSPYQSLVYHAMDPNKMIFRAGKKDFVFDAKRHLDDYKDREGTIKMAYDQLMVYSDQLSTGAFQNDFWDLSLEQFKRKMNPILGAEQILMDQMPIDLGVNVQTNKALVK